MQAFKFVVVGDGTVGKTCLLISYAHNEFPKQYVPTIFDTYSVDVKINEEKYKISLFDTAGQEDYDRLRHLAYPRTNCFLVCFSIENKSSYENIKDKWIPEIKHHCPKTPYILVGTKIDLRKTSTKVLTTAHGESLAKEIRAVKYVECSAKTHEGLKDVFDQAILATLMPKQTKKPCTLL